MPGGAAARDDSGTAVAGEENTAKARMDAAKRALQEEAKRRQQELDETLRGEAEVREKEEALRKLREPEKKKRAPVEEPAPEPAPEPADAQAAAAAPVAIPPPAAAMPPAAPAGKKAPAPPSRRSDAKRSERGDGRGRRGERGRRGREELHVASDKAGRRRKKQKSRPVVRTQPARHGFEMPTAPVVRDVAIPETITVGELAQKMSIKANELIKALMGLGMMVTINQVIDQDAAVLVVEELGHVAKPVKDSSIEEEVLQAGDDGEFPAAPRSPVVTVMGHVDHGKTSLLDYIRTARVAAGEAGGITQHIGAYHVETPRGNITFLDTPGHAAFTAMRARGARATDIVVLVVAADDGVMPQTVRGHHPREGGGRPHRGRRQQDRQGGRGSRAYSPIPLQPRSRTRGLGRRQHVCRCLRADRPGCRWPARDHRSPGGGTRAHRSPRRSCARCRRRVAHRARAGSGRHRARAGRAACKGRHSPGRPGVRPCAGLFDEAGAETPSAGPSTPVEVLGLSGPPGAGDEAIVVADERKAREIASFRHGKYREVRLARRQASKLENVFEQMKEGETNTLNIIVKADVQGSVEALRDALTQLSTDEVKVNVVSAAAGGISETDANLAVASNAIVVGFNVRADVAARRVIEAEFVDLQYFSVIYEVIDTVKQAMNGMLAPAFREDIIGIAEVRDVFRSKRFGNIAGCQVSEGMVRRSNPIRVLRDSVVIYEGELESLRRFQDDASEVRAGTDCGIGVRNYNDVKVGDQIEVYERVQIERTV